MRVGSFRPRLAPALYALYRQATDHLAHCRFVPSAAVFADALEHSTSTGAANWPAQPLHLSLGSTIVDASACFRREVAAR